MGRGNQHGELGVADYSLFVYGGDSLYSYVHYLKWLSTNWRLSHALPYY